MTSRPHTKDEIRENFVQHARVMVQFWLLEERAPSALEKLEGLAFSILVLLDGGTSLPAFAVTPQPHPSDKAFHEENGENWYPDDVDIAGELHELFCELNRKAKQ